LKCEDERIISCPISSSLEPRWSKNSARNENAAGLDADRPKKRTQSILAGRLVEGPGISKIGFAGRQG
jgi:hypothetical protein